MSQRSNLEGDKEALEPFLRWAGGKRWLAKTVSPMLERILQESGGTYFEPFLGAGAMFFGLAPQRAVLSDINSKLIETYKTVARSALDVERLVGAYPVDADTYYRTRHIEPTDPVVRAARFIYLNRTCYGGLYRENQSGKFNTPFGGGSRTPDVVIRKRLISRSQFALRGVKLLWSDFEETVSMAQSGDVVYCDPTYSSVKRDGFDRYGANVFDWSDQERLAYCSEKAMERGVTVLVSNGSFQELFDLYPAAYRIPLSRKKTIGNRPKRNDRNDEHLLILDPHNRRKLWATIGTIENRKSKSRYSYMYEIREIRKRMNRHTA